MEEKIYERQVTKLSLSQRVVDEHQIERHFTMRDLQELYTFKPDRLDDPSNPDRPIPELPSDRLLAELLSSQKDWIVQYHQHDSLLENQLDEGLSEEDRKAAWEEYEAEKKGMFRREPRQSWEASQNYNYLTSQMSQMPPINLMELSRSIYMQNPEFTPEQVQMKMHQMIQMYRQRQEQYLLMQRERERLMELHLQRQMQQAASGAPRGVSSMLLNLMQGQQQQQQQDQQ